MESPTELLTASQTARRLCITYGTLAQWRHHRRQKLAFVRVGRKILYRATDIEKFLADNTYPGDGPGPAESKQARPRRRTR